MGGRHLGGTFSPGQPFLEPLRREETQTLEISSLLQPWRVGLLLVATDTNAEK